jgi:transposase-like protein
MFRIINDINIILKLLCIFAKKSIFMKTLVENINEHLAMSKEDSKAFFDNLYDFLFQNEADAVDYQGLKIQSTPPLCPNCRSNNIVKNGKQKGIQNYRCKHCGRQFRVTTGTYVYRLKKPQLMLEYIRCMVAGKSLRACAREVGISLPTSFTWRHKILAALKNFDKNVNFFGIVETDELLMDYSEKGRKYSSVKEMKQSIRKKPKKVAVIVATDRCGNILFRNTENKRVNREDIEKFLKGKIPEDAVLCTGTKYAFRHIRKSKVKHKEIVGAKKKKRGIYSTAIVKAKAEEFVKWIYSKFRGVATKYLQNYIMWYVAISKYLSGDVISNTGRILNLASSDRSAWYEYFRVSKISYII